MIGITSLATTCLILIRFGHSFQIVGKRESHKDGVELGEKITLTCVSNERFDYCSWSHNATGSANGTTCGAELYGKDFRARPLHSCNLPATFYEIQGSVSTHECTLIFNGVTKNLLVIFNCHM